MKILVVAPNVDLGTVKGDSVHLRNVLHRWSRDHEVHVITAVDESDCMDDVELLIPSNVSSGPLPDYAVRAVKSLVSSFSLSLEHEYDLVYERHHLFGSGMLGTCLASCPTALEVNGASVKEHEVKGSISSVTATLLRFLERRIVELADRVICVSPRLAEKYRDAGVPADKISVVNNGCDTEMFRPFDNAKRRLSWEEDVNHVGFVGSLAHWHGVEKVVEALPHVLEREPRTELVIVGDGPLRETLAEQVANLGLDESVRFVGKVPHEQVPLFMAAFDVGTILKHPDIPGSPLKLYEYLACGTPVIATDDADFALLNEREVGVTVSYESPNDIADGILRLLRADSEALSGAARDVGLDHSWESVAEKALSASTE